MAQWVNVPAIKPDNPSSQDRKRNVSSRLSSDLYTSSTAHVCGYTSTLVGSHTHTQRGWGGKKTK